MSSSLTSSSNESIWQKIQREKQEDIDGIIEADDEKRERTIRMIENYYATSLSAVLGNPFQFIDSTASDPHVSKTHAPANKHTCFVNVANARVDDKFWESTFVTEVVKGERSNYKSIDSEQDVQAASAILVQSIIRGLMLNQEIRLSQNRTVAGVECDIVLSYGTQKIPFAAIEVKKPGPRLPDNASGMDHLHEIDEAHDHNYGEEFTDEGPNKSRPFAEKACDITTNEISPDPQTIFDIDVADTGHTQNHVMDEANRVLTVSQPVSFFNSPEHCIYLIRAFILRAYHRLSEKTTLKGLKRSCRVLTITTGSTGLSVRNEDGCSFQFVRVQEPAMLDNLSNRIDFSNDKLKKIYLIKNIGAGVNGDCCLAMDQTGNNYCAVKFFVQPVDALAEEEYNLWMKIYPDLKNYIHLEKRTIGKAFLCMPYLKPISKFERLQLTASYDNNGTLVSALREMVKNKYVHRYVLWRHIGKCGDKLCFLDFGMDGMTKAPDTEQSKELWVEQGFRTLKDHAGPPELSTPTHKKQKM
eukprot:scaffold22488_cov40-Attheya_sp.AAC.3